MCVYLGSFSFFAVSQRPFRFSGADGAFRRPVCLRRVSVTLNGTLHYCGKGSGSHLCISNCQIQLYIIFGVYPFKLQNKGIFLSDIYSGVVGCPHALILTTLTMGTADRFTSMAHPQFYSNPITKSRIL